MATLKEEAQAYEPPQTKNIADLEAVPLGVNIEDREATNKAGKPFSYKVMVLNNEEYRVPNSVLRDIQTVMEEKPELKTIKVVKKGEGLNTEYTVIPLE